MRTVPAFPGPRLPRASRRVTIGVLGCSLAALLLVGPAAAQTLPPEQDKALWCASALIIAGEGTGSEDSELSRRGNSLLAETQLMLLEQGYGDEQIKDLVGKARTRASRELLDPTVNPQFSYEDCLDVDGR